MSGTHRFRVASFGHPGDGLFAGLRFGRRTLGGGRHAASGRIRRSMSSSTIASGGLQRTWDKITDVDIADFSHPTFFKLAGIPHPLRAEVLADGVGGERIAYFDTGKRFIQRITVWDPLREYAFTFNPEEGFTVAYLFDLSGGVVQIPSGSYLLEAEGSRTRITLATEYSIDRRVHVVIEPGVRIMLKLFQRYLLTSIARNVRRDDRP